MCKIAFLGTSITKGTSYGGVTTAQTFANLIGVSNGYTTSNILNKGVNSDTSSGMVLRLNTDIILNTPDVCVVEVGPNDWSTSVSLTTYRSNLDYIFSQIKSAGIKPVALNSSMQRGPTTDFLSYQNYLKVFEDSAASNDVILIDLYRELATSYLYYTSTQFYALYTDSIHFTPTGHQFVANLCARPKYSGVFVV